MSDIDRETRKAKRYELGVHCSQLCLGGRASLIETTDPDPFNEDVVMATDYDDLLTRYDRAIALLQEAVPKVRAILYRLWAATGPEISDDQITAAIAELDAQPKREAVPVEAIRTLCARGTWPAQDQQCRRAEAEVTSWLAAVEGTKP